MKVIKRILIIILLIIIFIVAGFLYKGHELYKQALEKISISDKVAEIKSDENYTKIEDMSEFYKDAVIAVEDRRFYEHGAIDPIALATHFGKSTTGGGSTITQQLAKNIYFTQEKSALRKIAEIFMAYDLEKNLNKDTILELYLNTSYFGDGYYCVAEASRGYYKKEPKDMNRNEASMLAGIPNAPSAYCPTKHLDLAKKRQNQVLDKMVRYEFITAKEKEEILNESNAVEDNKD